MLKRILSVIISAAVIFSFSGCDTASNNEAAPAQSGALSDTQPAPEEAPRSAEEITASLTLVQKAAQMVQGAGYFVDNYEMEKTGYGSILHRWDRQKVDIWKEFILGMQESALKSPAGIPYIYGTDAVHGLIKGDETVVFPHNIGIGAANDPDLTYKMGLAVADEAKLAGMLWNFSPCVSTATDPRWGRTYECFSSETELVSKLGAAFIKGNIDGGILPCAKHFLGEGDAPFGSGEGDFLIDRGEAVIDDARLTELLSVYKNMIDAGVKSVMVSHCAVNGLKMHANKELITGKLKGELGFDGMVVSDWESIHNIPDMTLKEQVIAAVNAGIDMLMEPEAYRFVLRYIVEGAHEGLISLSRIDDAVTRIIKVKLDMGIFDDPMMENLTTVKSEVGSAEYRDLARQLVEKSLVLLKNDNGILPLKKGSKIFVTGPASNDTGALCGGWTFSWSGSTDNGSERFVPEGKTILDGIINLSQEYEFTVITDPNEAYDADLTILCVGEIPYAEWDGDSEDISITGKLALSGNKEAIQAAKDLGKPVVACLVAGRNIIYEEYDNDWDAVVMCYLPGSEGDGVANVLAGKAPFTGKLPMPYYSSVDDIKTVNEKFDIGYGLSY